METIDLLKTGDVAHLLGVSRQHVVDLCERGEIEFVWVGKHRRVPRSEVSRIKGDLTREQERSLWLHQALLTNLLADPQQVVAKALANVERWRPMHRPDGMTASYLDQWQTVLTAGLDVIVETLVSRSPEACELRQNTPFAGVLPEETRRRVLESFNQHWSHEHQAA